ncbi:MAG: phospholipase D-like domain-containing protein [Gammaproteobacteria bacterium]|nr:phospholipase D-like domain-containing protein [Gammaproteobacteria bacterium]
MATVKDKHYRYPWRDGNHFELLIDGEQFFPPMLQAINEARSHVLLEFYLFESGNIADTFIQTLCAAAERGVKVYLLLDDFGARGLHRQDLRILQGGGVELAFYNPLRYGRLRRNLLRDHRKLLCVDGHTAFTGGTGITDEFDSAGNPGAWHEVMLRGHGPVVADWQQLFQENWQRWSQSELQLSTPPEDQHSGTQRGRLAPSSPAHADIKRSLINRLRGAEQRIWIATAYFIPSRKIRRLLRRAARSGADVRLLLPGPHTDHPAVRHAGRRFYARLLRHGVRIYEYQPRFLHAKVLLCDDWVSIGSSNIDRWNLRWNLEANQEIASAQMARKVACMFEQDFSDSHEVKAEHWYRRPWHRRLLEWLWGSVDLWVERRSQRHKDD